jgi:Spy/CpxP family protein refolding chaperone
MQARKLALVCAAAAVALTITVSSFAQNPARQRQGQRRGQGRNSVASLPVNVIDSIVKLTPEQKTKVTTIHDKYEADTRALRPQQGAQPEPANTQKLRDISRQAVADIEALLNQEQKDKLKAANKDLQLYRSVGIPVELYGQVKLTDEQKTKLAAIEKETTEKSQGVDQAQRRQINQEARTKAEALLTADQKAAIEKYRKEHPREGRRPRP